MNLLLHLLVFFHVASCIDPHPFRRLSQEENEKLLETCGRSSLSTQRKIFNATVVPPTESVFTARIHWNAQYYGGVLISSRHILTTNNHKVDNMENCIGEHFKMDDQDARRITVGVNEQSTEFSTLELKVRKALNFFGCSTKFGTNSSFWVYELEEDVFDSKHHRPICLLNNNNRLSTGVELMLYGNGLTSTVESKFGQRKTPVNITECPEKYGNESFCGVAKAAVCFGDFGSGVVLKEDNRNYLAGLMQYIIGSNIMDKLECKGESDGADIPLVFLPVSAVLDLLCEEIGICQSESAHKEPNHEEIRITVDKPMKTGNGCHLSNNHQTGKSGTQSDEKSNSDLNLNIHIYQ